MYKMAWYVCTIGNGAETEILSIESMKVPMQILGSEHEERLASKAMVVSACNLGAMGGCRRAAGTGD
jgi:hypothetical protein